MSKLRDIPDSEIRIGIGKIPNIPTDGEWYVTRYSRDLKHDLADGWYPTYEAAAEASRKILGATK